MEFENHLHTAFESDPAAPGPRAARFERAVALFTGAPFDGIYRDWAIRERERVTELARESLGALITHYRRSGQADRALFSARRLIEIDPLDAVAHQEIIRIHLESGRTLLAREQYERCRRFYSEEIGAAPPARIGSLLTDRALIAEGGAFSDAAVLDQLGNTLSALASLHSQVEALIHLLRNN